MINYTYERKLGSRWDQMTNWFSFHRRFVALFVFTLVMFGAAYTGYWVFMQLSAAEAKAKLWQERSIVAEKQYALASDELVRLNGQLQHFVNQAKEREEADSRLKTKLESGVVRAATMRDVMRKLASDNPQAYGFVGEVGDASAKSSRFRTWLNTFSRDVAIRSGFLNPVTGAEIVFDRRFFGYLSIVPVLNAEGRLSSIAVYSRKANGEFYLDPDAVYSVTSDPRGATYRQNVRYYERIAQAGTVIESEHRATPIVTEGKHHQAAPAKKARTHRSEHAGTTHDAAADPLDGFDMEPVN